MLRPIVLVHSLVVGTLALGACHSALQPRSTSEPLADSTFPDAWLGHWIGTVAVHGPDGPRPGFGMERIIEATDNPDRLRWATIYSGASGRQERHYTLIAVDRKRGEFQIDEHNGIVLEARLLGDTLISWFEVQDSLLTVRERLDDGVLTFEIVTAAASATVPTGKSTPVTNRLPQVLQRARLTRR